jgi:hypothetical protein
VLALLQETASELPLWLQKTEAWATIAQGFGTPLLIFIGGIFAWYKFFRQGEHDPRLQSAVSGTATVHDSNVIVVAAARAENTGLVDVDLNLESSGLEVLTTRTGDEGWTSLRVVDVFVNHGVVQPGETIEDRVWFEIPYAGEAGVKLNLTVAPTESRSYPTTEIISLLPQEGEKRREDG